jgi:hypothetical protein
VPESAVSGSAISDYQWDEIFDVVVVGSGGGALTAALLAARGGASTVVVEKDEFFGGTTAVSGGDMWIQNNRFVKDRDSREDALTYIRRLSDGRASDPELQVSFPEQRRGQVGAEELATRQREVWLAKGGGLIAPLLKGVIEAGGELRASTPAVELATDDAGAVVGVVVKGSDGPRRIGARQGIVLAYVEKGEDPDWGDPGQTHVLPGPDTVNRKPITRPVFGAIPQWPGTLGSNGGLRVDKNARVLGYRTPVIDGHYAAGNTAASVLGAIYGGGGSCIGPSVTFGYIAGRHLAGNAPRDIGTVSSSAGSAQ